MQRHDEIQTFKPDAYWVLQVRSKKKNPIIPSQFYSITFLIIAQVTVKSPDSQDVILSWGRVRSFDKEVANIFLSHVKEHEYAM